MFKTDKERNMQHYLSADLINVRANKDGLQFCIFKVDEKIGSYTILNEGHLPIGTVLTFKLAQPIFAAFK